MSLTPIRQPFIELRCKKNSDGTYEVGSYEDGKVLIDPKFRTRNGTCDDVNRIYGELRLAYQSIPINVGEKCRDCINNAT